MKPPLSEERLTEIRLSLNSVQRVLDPWPPVVQELFDEVCALRVALTAANQLIAEAADEAKRLQGGLDGEVAGVWVKCAEELPDVVVHCNGTTVPILFYRDLESGYEEVRLGTYEGNRQFRSEGETFHVDEDCVTRWALINFPAANT